MKFYQLAVGARFRHRGARFKKAGMSCAEDERGWANVFLGLVEIEPEGEPLLMSPAEATRWQPDYGLWTEFIERECGAEGKAETLKPES